MFNNSLNLSCSSYLEDDIRPLVEIKDGVFYPLIKSNEINRDMFFHLRKQLINLGCDKEKVICVAKEMCMDVLNIDSEKDYLKFVYNDSYNRCSAILRNGYNLIPLHDINSPSYSHMGLFSSIYGFELDWLKSCGFCNEIADIGCGEGLLNKLALNDGIEIDSYDIKKPLYSDKCKINVIEDFYDIEKGYRCLIYNHVLEHIALRPDYYLKLVIDHFNELKSNLSLSLIFVSLPLHKDISAHLASNHFWVCADENEISYEFKYELKINGLRTFNPLKTFKVLCQKYNFNLSYNNKIGVYVFER